MLKFNMWGYCLCNETMIKFDFQPPPPNQLTVTEPHLNPMSKVVVVHYFFVQSFKLKRTSSPQREPDNVGRLHKCL